MKKLFAEAQDVPQSVANRGVRIVERYLRIHRVDRAKDLPEEAKVRLYRDLKEFFEAELRSGTGGATKQREERQGTLARLLRKLEDFLSFSEVSLAFGIPINLIANPASGEFGEGRPRLAGRPFRHLRRGFLL